MFRRLYPSVALSLTCLLSGLALSQEAGRIQGQIRVTRGDFPPHPIMVELQLRGATINSVYTDAQGHFGFYQLESNPYHVIVNDDDYYPVDELANLNLDESQFTMVQIFLRPREKKNADPLGKQAAGSNPYIVDQADYNRRFPKKAVREYDKGLEAEKKGEKEAAIQHYEAALKIASDYYPAHNNLGTLYLGKSDFKSAEEQFREAVRLDQNDAQAHFNLANVLLLTQRYPAAEREIEEGLRRRPDSAFGHFLQGSLYSRTGRPELAEKSLQSALQLDPKMSQAYLQLVNLYVQQKRRPEAIAELEAYLKAFPDSTFSPKARDLLKRLQGDASASPQ